MTASWQKEEALRSDYEYLSELCDLGMALLNAPGGDERLDEIAAPMLEAVATIRSRAQMFAARDMPTYLLDAIAAPLRDWREGNPYPDIRSDVRRALEQWLEAVR